MAVQKQPVSIKVVLSRECSPAVPTGAVGWAAGSSARGRPVESPIALTTRGRCGGGSFASSRGAPYVFCRFCARVLCVAIRSSCLRVTSLVVCAARMRHSLNNPKSSVRPFNMNSSICASFTLNNFLRSNLYRKFIIFLTVHSPPCGQSTPGTTTYWLSNVSKLPRATTLSLNDSRLTNVCVRLRLP